MFRFLVIIAIFFFKTWLIDAEIDAGATNIFDAVLNNNIGAVNAFISAGVSVNTADASGWTPLMLTTQTGNFELSEIFISHDADVNMVENDGFSALIFAILYERWNIVDLLLSRNADVLVETRTGITPLSAAREKNNDVLIQRFEAATSERNERYTVLSNALIDAATEGKVDDLVRLVEIERVNVDVQRLETGLNALIAAASSGHDEAVRYLLRAGAKVDHEEMDGWTPLMFACARGFGPVIDLLLEAGANVLHISKTDVTIPGAASLGGFVELSRGLADLALQKALDIDLSQRFVELIISGADSDRSKVSGWTALHALAYENNIEGVRSLVDLKVNLNRQEKDGWSPLMLAAYQEHNDVVDLLLSGGADIGIRNAAGKTAVEIATIRFLKTDDFNQVTPQTIRQFTESNTDLANTFMRHYARYITDSFLASERDVSEVVEEKTEPSATVEVIEKEEATIDKKAEEKKEEKKVKHKSKEHSAAEIARLKAIERNKNEAIPSEPTLVSIDQQSDLIGLYIHIVTVQAEVLGFSPFVFKLDGSDPQKIVVLAVLLTLIDLLCIFLLLYFISRLFVSEKQAAQAQNEVLPGNRSSPRTRKNN